MRTTTSPTTSTTQGRGSRRLRFALALAALAAAGSPAVSAQASSGWILPISDENVDQDCPFAEEAVTGVICSGSYCDSVLQHCQMQPSGYERWRWTGYTSEESAAAVCQSPYEGTFGAITGMGCTGSYCDNMRLQCGYANHAHSDCGWTSWVSEEGGGFLGWGEQVARSLQCSGDYCDNMRFLVCTQT